MMVCPARIVVMGKGDKDRAPAWSPARRLNYQLLIGSRVHQYVKSRETVVSRSTGLGLGGGMTLDCLLNRTITPVLQQVPSLQTPGPRSGAPLVHMK